jgi:hypothetical protein
VVAPTNLFSAADTLNLPLGSLTRARPPAPVRSRWPPTENVVFFRDAAKFKERPGRTVLAAPRHGLASPWQRRSRE